jgi:hypothetical protein
MNPLIQRKQTNTVFFVALLIAFFAIPQNAQAVAPPPDGCYPNYTTAEGCNALNFLTTGAGNTGLGWSSLFLDTTGNFNTGVDGGALALNNADSNTAVGAAALLLNTSGTENTAVGTDTMVFNDTGIQNAAVGAFALFSNVDGINNTANGFTALFNNTTGSGNTANGAIALLNNTTGLGNTGNGFSTLVHNTTGENNTATGNSALFNNITGSGNTALGSGAGTDIVSANNVIAIGHPAADVNDSCFIGNIRGVTTAENNAIPVVIDAVGQLGTMSSSKRFKKEIQPMDDVSEAILGLKPVMFHYKSDKTNRPEFGLIAEKVAKVNAALVVPDSEGKPYTVRYDAVNAMLLNEFLKAHRRMKEQNKRIDQLTAQLKQQAALIQKVSDRVKLNQAGPQAVER